MSVQVVVAITEIAAVVVGAGAILLALKGVREQLWLMTFTEYTKRYSDIVKDLPSEARRPQGNFDLTKLDPEQRDRVLNTMRNYLNLCSEEYFLAKRGRIDPETWGIWQAGISETLNLPWCRETWDAVRDEYRYFQEFCDFVGGICDAKAPAETVAPA